MTKKIFNLEVEASEYELMRFVKMLNKLNYNEIQSCAINEEDAYIMKSGLSAIIDALNRAGFNPR